MKTNAHAKVLIQILIWFLAWTIMAFIITNATDSPERFMHHSILNFVGMVVIISINMYVLLPRLYFKNNQLLFILAGVLLIFLTQEIIYWEQAPWSDWTSRPKNSVRNAENVDNARRQAMRYFARMMPLLVAFLGNSLWVISEYARVKEKEVLSIAKEKLESDVKFLKSQINPHFLFNALNNIYSLSVLKSDKTPDSILSLSDMLRYMLYESDGEKVMLQKEIDYINNFVQLHLLKDSRGLNVELDMKDCNSNVMIAPLLFIPFIENAFKHSHIENLENGFIKIKLSTEEKTIKLFIENSLASKSFSKDKVGGIGLQNVKNRLELLYPNAHNLEIKKDDNTYTVNLSIEI